MRRLMNERNEKDFFEKLIAQIWIYSGKSVPVSKIKYSCLHHISFKSKILFKFENSEPWSSSLWTQNFQETLFLLT
jgi:hypothetical protein